MADPPLSSSDRSNEEKSSVTPNTAAPEKKRPNPFGNPIVSAGSKTKEKDAWKSVSLSFDVAGGNHAEDSSDDDSSDYSGDETKASATKTKCIEVLRGLQMHEHGWVFQTPVDPVAFGLPDYFDIIKHHMDLGTIQKKLESGSYHAIEDFKDDCRLTFDNAMKYNKEQTVVHEMAKTLKKKFEADYKRLTKDETDDDDLDIATRKS